jgi:Flp pilus assembly pilin Flp
MMFNQPERKDKAQGLIEYALLLALLAVTILVVLRVFGINLQDVYCKVVKGVGGGGGTCSRSYCSDTFDNTGGWPASSGWAIQNGKMCNTQPGEQRAINTCSQTGNMPNNYMVTAKGASLTGGNGYGIIFRQSRVTPFESYVFQYDPGLGGFCIRKWVNGSELGCIAYSAAPAGFNWNAPNRNIQVQVENNVFKAYVDGQLVLTGTDPSYNSGGVGFRTWDSTNVCFDDFSITPLP